MLKDRLHCWLNLHQPVRNRVHTDGAIYRGQCRHGCGTIYREAPGRWRADHLAQSDGLPKPTIRR